MFRFVVLVVTAPCLTLWTQHYVMVTALTLTTTPDAVYLVLLTVAAVFLANTTQHRDGGGGGEGRGRTGQGRRECVQIINWGVRRKRLHGKRLRNIRGKVTRERKRKTTT